MAKTKKKTETVHLGLLVDESGSMGGTEEAVIQGCNEFVEGLRGDEEVAAKNVRVTLAMFDKSAAQPPVRVKYEAMPLTEVPEMTASDYNPRGMTPLNDAVLETIASMEVAAKKGDKAMLVIFTDGLENASEATADMVKERISEREAAGWTFIYLGANQDAWGAGARIGMKANMSKGFTSTPRGVKGAMGATTDMALAYMDSTPENYNQAMASLGDTIGESGLSDAQAKALAAARGKKGKKS